MALIDVFIGSAPSRYAALAITAALLAVGVVILASNNSVPLPQRFLAVLFLFLTTLPAILITLLQLTCLVTGSAGGENWWCSGMSWVTAIVIIVYAASLVIMAALSLVGDRKAEELIARFRAHEGFEEANQTAKELLGAHGGADGAEEEHGAEHGAEGYENAPHAHIVHAKMPSPAVAHADKDNHKPKGTTKETFVDYPAFHSQDKDSAAAVQPSDETFAKFGAPIAA